MNKKIRNYKPGDKVIILKNNYCNHKVGDVGFIIMQNPNPGFNNCWVVDVKRKISISGNWTPYVSYLDENIEYYYEKPLKELRNKIYNDYYNTLFLAKGIKINKDVYGTISNFINKEETLTNEEIKQCALIWEKYNKNYEKIKKNKK